jgi:hypothetical protein
LLSIRRTTHNQSVKLLTLKPAILNNIASNLRSASLFDLRQTCKLLHATLAPINKRKTFYNAWAYEAWHTTPFADRRIGCLTYQHEGDFGRFKLCAGCERVILEWVGPNSWPAMAPTNPWPPELWRVQLHCRECVGTLSGAEPARWMAAAKTWDEYELGVHGNDWLIKRNIDYNGEPIYGAKMGTVEVKPGREGRFEIVFIGAAYVETEW